MFQAFINLLNTRRFTLLCLIVFLVPFFVFSFWNHLSYDDYVISLKVKTQGFWPLQIDYYTNWTGRYIFTLSSSVLIISNLLHSKTYLIGVYFLTATAVALFYMTFQINRHLLQNLLTKPVLFLISLVLLILELNTIPQPTTAFYWFSGAITYQQPLILFFLLTGSVTGLFFTVKRKTLYTVITILLLVCMLGCNEMFTIWILLFTTLLASYYLITEHKNRGIIIFFMLCNYAFALTLLLAPGNFHRAALMEKSSVFTILGISIAKFTFLNWFFLKEPLWWFLLLLLSANTSIRDRLFRNAILAKLRQVKLANLLVIYAALGVLTYFPILYVSNASIAYRMENPICFLSGLTLMSILYLKIPEKAVFYNHSLIYSYRFILISVFVFCSSNMERISQTIFSGFIYNEVMEERLSRLNKASASRLSNISLDNYDLSAQKKINAHFPKGPRKTMDDLMKQKPSLLFFADDLGHPDNIKLLEQFYRINTIIVLSGDAGKLPSR